MLILIIIFELLLITTGGIVGFILELDVLSWMWFNWYYIFILFIPIIIVSFGMYYSRKNIRKMINELPADRFEDVLIILNEFKVFGEKQK